MKKNILLASIVSSLFIVIIPNYVSAQNIGINSTGGVAHPSALLDVDASPNNNKGILIPRLTTTQRLAIAAPAIGLQVFDTNLQGIYMYFGTKWDCVNNPAGTIQYFANINAPIGYLECNGQAISRTNYPELFNAIGTLYGVGDGTTTFNVPDLRGEFVRGFDNNRAIDAGRAIGTWQKGSYHSVGSNPNTDDINDYSTSINSVAVADDFGLDSPVGQAVLYPNLRVTSGGTAPVLNIANTNADLDFSGGVTRPRNIALLSCIKY